jgi:hypothetical protein
MGRTCCKDATLHNGWSQEGTRYMTCKARRLDLGQELGLIQVGKVLESPKQRLGTKRTRGNQSIKNSIQVVP